MNPAAQDIASALISLAAVLGLMQVVAVLYARGPQDPINRRFIFGLRVLMAIFLGRLFIAITGADFFRIFILIGAALVPLSVILLTEGLLRRHMPRPIKVITAVGTVFFGVTGLWFGEQIDAWRLWALLGFQLLGMGFVAWAVLTRDKASLSPAENATVDRLALSLLLLVPLIAVDYLIDVLGFPVQVAGLGVLFLCWLAVSLGRQEASHWTSLLRFGVMALAAIIAGWGVAWILPQADGGAIYAVTVILAIVLCAAVVNEAQSLKTEARSLSLVAFLAEGDVSSPEAILSGLQRNRTVSGAVLLGEDALSDLDPGAIGALFHRSPVLRAVSPPENPAQREVAEYLFERFSVSHILDLGRSPPVLLALSLPALAASARAEQELAVLARLAREGAR